MGLTVNIAPEFPPKAAALFKPSPYKVMHGGRAGSKSWNFCRALLILGLKRKLFILCAREIQKSIKESVYKLLCDQIVEMKLHAHISPDTGQAVSAFYEVKDTEIVGRNGTRFVFAQLRNNIDSIKSMEAVDICAVFEATTVSQASWEKLLPTIRRDPPYGPFGQGSEIWIEFNPELTNDYTYKYWVLNPPEGTVVIEINFYDNPWFPENSRRQKDEMKKRDPDAYQTVWLGKTRRVLQGAIYAKELSKAIEDGRISPKIKYDKTKPVFVTFDLGRADMTALWFVQQIGMVHNVIDFHEDCGHDFSHYLEVIDEKKYHIGGIWLPHDAKQKHASALKSIERQARDAYRTEGIVRVAKVPLSQTLTINALRGIFPRLYFNEELCSVGINSLIHYQFGVNSDTKQRTALPLHNWASHASKALELYPWLMHEGDQDIDDPFADYDVATDTHSPSGQSWMQ